MSSIIRAFQLLTAFPIPSDLGNDGGGGTETSDGKTDSDDNKNSPGDFIALKREIAASTAYFPLVGATQGILLVICWKLFSYALPAGVVSGLLVVVLVLTNYGFHLDGLADTVDGLAGGSTKEGRLRIMRKSDIGPMGVIAIVVVLIIKYAALSAILGGMDGKEGLLNSGAAVIFLFPVMGRFAIVPMACWSRYAREGEGLGSALSENAPGNLAVALVTVLVFSILLLGPVAILLVAILMAASYFAVLYFKEKVGGVTGDIFGFQSELSEVMFLVSALALLPLVE